jgi:hypothetical protein
MVESAKGQAGSGVAGLDDTDRALLEMMSPHWPDATYYLRNRLRSQRGLSLTCRAVRERLQDMERTGMVIRHARSRPNQTEWMLAAEGPLPAVSGQAKPTPEGGERGTARGQEIQPASEGMEP